jgi:hypothetical protein
MFFIVSENINNVENPEELWNILWVFASLFTQRSKKPPFPPLFYENDDMRQRNISMKLCLISIRQRNIPMKLCLISIRQRNIAMKLCLIPITQRNITMKQSNVPTKLSNV